MSKKPDQNGADLGENGDIIKRILPVADSIESVARRPTKLGKRALQGYLTDRLSRGKVFCALVLATVVAFALGIAWSHPAMARPDPPVIIGSTAICTGDQHLGIASGVDFPTPPIYTLMVTSLTTDITPADGVAGIKIIHQGANGANGHSYPVEGGDGGPGDPGQDLTVNFDGGSQVITTHGDSACGILVQSSGGLGGDGGNGYGIIFPGIGGNGGNGGNGGAVTVTSHSDITTSGASAHGIAALSIGGAGGQAGWGGGIAGVGGSGGVGGTAGAVTVTSSSDITTTGDNANGIFAESLGGNGGEGGSGYGIDGEGGNGGYGGNSGDVTVASDGGIITTGDNANGIFALSQAGAGGKGGDAGGIHGGGGDGGVGGTAGVVMVTSHSAITTSGTLAQGIRAQSLGGAGGDGGFGGGVIGQGGAALGSGPGGRVEVTSTGAIQTYGLESRGIFAQSVGGFAGSSGGAGGLFAFGASGQSGGSGGEVMVTNGGAIRTLGAYAEAIYAQSVGGGGGTGGTAGGVITVGGNGGAGGHGGAVTVTNTNQLLTLGEDAGGIFAQSVGGGGGDGGKSYSAGLQMSVSVGGQGGPGGDGGQVNVSSGKVTIDTAGDRACGIQAQSVGGGGGAGGYAISAAAGQYFTISVAVGGAGGDGGQGGVVKVDSDSAITTHGSDAHGIFAESVGGGGGCGGFAITGTAGDGWTGSLSLGGSGGKGGSGQSVTVNSTGDISTQGFHSYGILAQSVGGGGGDGGFSIDGSLATTGQTGFSIGGSGGDGGNGGAVQVNSSGNILTFGELAYGILAQSVGGGGGSGGYSIAAGVTPVGASFNYAMGGKGGAGGDGGMVEVTSSGSILTNSKGSHGILAQSVGGGGGAGGFAGSLAGCFGDGGALAVGVGGSGGGGGNSANVSVDNQGAITTLAEASYGILAQSVGGGGGDGGAGLAADLGAVYKKEVSIGVSVAVGGSGGAAGNGAAVEVKNTGAIETLGEKSIGILAQSIGGGGGNSGLSVAGSLSVSPTADLSVSIGGNGGGGGDADHVTVNSTGNITTHGNESVGIQAQSIGGGGGNGGLSLAGSFAGKDAKNLSLAIGGNGGTGGNGGIVEVTNSGTILTCGNDAHGILAQSIGGGGGTGGFAGAVDLGIAGDTSVNLGVSVGGKGGAGGYGESVTVNNAAVIATMGDESHGIFAQSIGGGGGAGGGSLAGSATLKAKNTVNLSVAVGGGGGDGNNGGNVIVNNQGVIDTSGGGSYGIFAQSVGGGGGSGGSARAMTLSKGSKENRSLSLAIGGSGGGASHGGSVTVNNTGSITTRGGEAHGIFAQSIGGGGGVGGNANQGLGLPTAEPDKDKNGIFKNLTLSIGGSAGSSGDGGQVSISNTGDITTFGEGSSGILGQSVGGGGGNGGNGVVGKEGTLTLGGSGSAAGNGGAVAITNSGMVNTLGDTAYGIFAQSVGGGGGAAGNAEMGEKGKIAIGAAGGAGGKGGAVQVNNSGMINTRGDGSTGIFAQSIGGGGGVAGNVKRGSKEFGKNLAIGRQGGAGGDGGAVTVTNTADITTLGAGAHGIFAQSVGGGGGLVGDLGQGINFAGTVGGDGDGGQVKVSQTGNITTMGDTSHGILAQSAGGKGTGGTVDITVAGEITAWGADSNGILAQSRGDKGAGDISINIISGLVQGGSGTGAGISFMDGANNTLTNRGTVTTVSGRAGMATVGTTGNEIIHNYGIITGSVDLGGGLNAFNNQFGGLFYAGSTVNLGSGNLFTNAGRFSPGSTQTFQTTVLTGNFLQTGLGIFQTQINGNGTFDQLRVMGTATLGGTLEVLRGPGPYFNGTTYNILEATTLQNRFSQEILPYAPLLSFSTNYFYDPTRPNLVQIIANAKSFTWVSTNRVEFAQAQYLDKVMPLATGDFARVIAEFQTLPMSQFRSAFASLSPGVYDANTLTTFSITRQYVRTLQQRMRLLRLSMASLETEPKAQSDKPILLAYNGPDSSLGQFLRRKGEVSRFGIWLECFGQFGNQRWVDGFSGFNYSMGGMALGLDYALTERLVIGANFGYSYSRIDQDDSFGSGVINSLYGSLYGTCFTERAYLEGILSYGNHMYKNSRRISIGSIQRLAESDHDGNAFSVFAEAGYKFNVQKCAVQPFGSLLYSYLNEGSFRESGANSLNMKVDTRETNSVVSELGLRAARPIKTSKGTLVPEVKAAWQYDFGVDKRTMPISFAGAPVGLTIDGRNLSKSSAVVGAGLTFTSKGGITTSLQYDAELRSGYNAHAVIGQIRWSF